MKWPSHGGQPETIKKMFALDEDSAHLIDFSANLNPLLPVHEPQEKLLLDSESIRRYPDPDYSQARLMIAKHQGIAKEQVLLTNGGAEAIFLAARKFAGQKALIIQPTFGEYERACGHYGMKTESLFLSENTDFSFPLDQVLERMKAVQAVFLCRPNNPTGTVASETAIRTLLREGQRIGCYIVIDEAFADFMPDHEPLTHWINDFDNLILLRSLTKMYTVPGLRIGYVIAADRMIEELQSYQIPWSVNAIAAAIVPKLLNDPTIIKETRAWLSAQLDMLKREYRKMGFYMPPTSANFYLLQDRMISAVLSPDRSREAAEALFRHLLHSGILPRHTHTFPALEGRYLRFAVRTEQENKKLLAALREWRAKQ
jgi:threonine-phosphate decarboxylase